MSKRGSIFFALILVAPLLLFRTRTDRPLEFKETVSPAVPSSARYVEKGSRLKPDLAVAPAVSLRPKIKKKSTGEILEALSKEGLESAKDLEFLTDAILKMDDQDRIDFTDAEIVETRTRLAQNPDETAKAVARFLQSSRERQDLDRERIVMIGLMAALPKGVHPELSEEILEDVRNKNESGFVNPAYFKSAAIAYAQNSGKLPSEALAAFMSEVGPLGTPAVQADIEDGFHAAQ